MTHASRAAAWDWAALHSQCLRSAQRVLGAQPAAEDAAQEASLKAWRHPTQCRTPERPEPAVAAIARRGAVGGLPPAPVSEPAEPVDPGYEPQVIRRLD